MESTLKLLVVTLAMGPAAWAGAPTCNLTPVTPFGNLGNVLVKTAVRTVGRISTDSAIPPGATAKITFTPADSFADVNIGTPAGSGMLNVVGALIPIREGLTTGSLDITLSCSPKPVTLTFSYTGLPNPSALTFEQNPNTGSVLEPVSAATGELFGHDESADLEQGGPLPLSFRRYYSSYLHNNGVYSALGNNWMHNFDLRVVVSGDTATVKLFRGKTVTFTRSNNAWQLSSTERRPYQLAAAGSGYQFMNPASNLIYTFDSGGSLTQVADRNGNILTVTPKPPDGPSSVSDGLGGVLTFTYAGANLTRVQDQTGRSVSFEYTGGNLSAWTDANGKRSTFTYASAGVFTGLMTTETRPAGNKPFSQVFDSQGRVTSQTDSFSSAMTLAYSAATNGATVTEPAGVIFTQAHDAKLNFTSESDPTGASSQYAYDANGRPTSVIDRMGAKTTATWDAASGRPLTYTDELGNTTAFRYTATSQGAFTFYDLSGVTFADDTTIALTRDAKGNVIALTDQSGQTWQATRNDRGQLSTLTNPSGAVTILTYGQDATLASLQTDSGDNTTFGYDAARRPNLLTQPDGAAQGLQYDPRNNLVGATDERSNTTAASFDDNNNLRTLTDALSAVTALAYDTDDRLVSATDALGKATRRTYDAMSRLRSVTDPAGVSVTYSYDTVNHLTSAVDATGKGLTYVRDKEGRLMSVTDALSRSTSLTRDARGRVTGLTTPGNQKFGVAYDALGRIVSTTDAANRVARFRYDPRGLLTQAALPGGVAASLDRNELGLITGITDPNGNVWGAGFDKMGRQVSSADPLGQTISYQYDSRQRVSTATLPLGSVQFLYDAAGNLTGSRYSDGTALNFTYDAVNRLVSADGLTLGYDAAGRIAASSGLQITYDDAGRIASIVYGAGKTVKYTYDNRGLLTQVADWVGGVTAFTYDAAQQVTSIVFPNGVRADYTYDNDGRTATLSVKKDTTTISSIALRRDALGRVIGADRTAATIPGVPVGEQQFSYDGAHQSSSASYDPMGRVASDAFRNYTWDLASRLGSYAGADGSASFTYDAVGQRISRTAGGVTESYAVNYALALPSLSVVRVAGADQRYYIWLPNGFLLSSIEATGGARHFYHFDESGSVNFLTGDSGAVTDTYAGTPYGETLIHTGSSDNPFTFQGAFGVMQEGSTGLYYMRARYYDSVSARFLSRDPVESLHPLQINPYQYARGNPVSYIDPSGTQDAHVEFYGHGYGFVNEDGVAEYRPYPGKIHLPKPAAKPKRPALKAWDQIPDNVTYIEESALGIRYLDANGTAGYISKVPEIKEEEERRWHKLKAEWADFDAKLKKWTSRPTVSKFVHVPFLNLDLEVMLETGKSPLEPFFDVFSGWGGPKAAPAPEEPSCSSSYPGPLNICTPEPEPSCPDECSSFFNECAYCH